MAWLRGAALALLMLPAAGALAEAPPASAPPAAVQAAPAPRQVMVMLHLPPAHFRAGDAYAGSYTNDGGSVARHQVARELAAQHGLELVADWPMPVLGVDCYVYAVPAAADVQAVADRLGRDARGEWAQPVGQYRTLGMGDPLYLAQPTARQWRLAELHSVSTGRKVTVAVIDSGADTAHPDLAGQVPVAENFIEGQRYVAEDHGTAVAGIIAARAGNGVGIRGVAPDARVLALRACAQDGGAAARCDSFSLGKALNFAILHQPDIINLSLTGPRDRLLERLLDAAVERGIRVVAAYDTLAPDGGFPAAWPGVIAVADGGAAPVHAPGRDIPAPLPGGRFGLVTGSSYAAANASGLLALLVQLRSGATLAGPATLDACALVGKMAASCVCNCPVVADLAPRR
jgi:subtilisin family serine protease